MLQAKYCQYKLIFKEVAITSRASMNEKDTYFVCLYDDVSPQVTGIGECAIFRGLSADDTPDYEEILREICTEINRTGHLKMPTQSSMRFGFETALRDLQNGGTRNPYPSAWSEGKCGIPINGLVWMGTIDEMARRVEQKLKQGFRCIKFKIGGQDFSQEFNLLKGLREAFSPTDLEIRLDANGAFTPENALSRLEALAPLSIHSLEQPIRPHQRQEMARICENSPIPIALDEELIGVDEYDEKERLIDLENPKYIILKPSLCGGISGAKEWIEIAQRYGVGWWVTSALESNIGLNMIAQWVSTLHTTMPQGLGTGALYVNNIFSPLTQSGDALYYDIQRQWEIPSMQWIKPK